MTAIVVECADWDALNANHAARMPAVCKALPTAIESRAKTLRFVMATAFTVSPFNNLMGQLCPSILPQRLFQSDCLLGDRSGSVAASRFWDAEDSSQNAVP